MPDIRIWSSTVRWRPPDGGGPARAQCHPALGEALPGFEVVTWYGLFAPVATPREVINRLNAESAKERSRYEIAGRCLTGAVAKAAT